MSQLGIRDGEKEKRRREGLRWRRKGEGEREIVYLALLVTLLWRLSSSHALDFLKLQHHRPSCQSWILIGWEELLWAHELHSSTLLAQQQAAGVQHLIGEGPLSSHVLYVSELATCLHLI